MNWKNVFIATFTIMNFFVSTAFAEIKTYEGVGEYCLTDETIDFAKEQAELDAQRNILNKICRYVKKNATTIDNELDEEEIITIAAGILRVIDVDFAFDADEDGILVKSFVTAEIDTDELETLLENCCSEQAGRDVSAVTR